MGMAATRVHGLVSTLRRDSAGEDRWQLFHVGKDRGEAHDLADQHPDKGKELAELWLAEAKKNKVLTIVDLGVQAVHALEFHAAPPAGGRTSSPSSSAKNR